MVEPEGVTDRHGTAFSQSDGTGIAQARIEELEQRIARLEERLRQLEAEPSTAVEPPASEVIEEERSTDPVSVSAGPPQEALRQVTASVPTSVPEIPTGPQFLEVAP